MTQHSSTEVSQSVPGILNSPVVGSNEPSSVDTFIKTPSVEASYLDFGEGVESVFKLGNYFLRLRTACFIR